MFLALKPNGAVKRLSQSFLWKHNWYSLLTDTKKKKEFTIWFSVDRITYIVSGYPIDDIDIHIYPFSFDKGMPPVVTGRHLL